MVLINLIQITQILIQVLNFWLFIYDQIQILKKMNMNIMKQLEL